MKNAIPYGGENLASTEAVEESRRPLHVQAADVA